VIASGYVVQIVAAASSMEEVRARQHIKRSMAGRLRGRTSLLGLIARPAVDGRASSRGVRNRSKFGRAGHEARWLSLTVQRG
jgi:hypothetical protein